jgi:hypothetical protein
MVQLYGVSVEYIYLCIRSNAVRDYFRIQQLFIVRATKKAAANKKARRDKTLRASSTTALSHTALNRASNYILPAPAPLCTMLGTLAAGSSV